MSHAYANNLIHLVFSTKERRTSIRPDLQDDLWKYMVGIGANHKIRVLAAGGMPDHAHLLFVLPAVMPLAKAIQTVKANSSRWMREQTGSFEWQRGYGAFSVSESNKPSVMRYIATQAEHHRERRFEDEFIALLKKHNVDYDPRYVFD